VPRGVDQVELVGLAVTGGIGQGDGLALDGDAALALQVEPVQELVLELALAHHPAVLDQAVGQGGLAVVDVRDDAEVASVFPDRQR